MFKNYNCDMKIINNFKILIFFYIIYLIYRSNSININTEIKNINENNIFQIINDLNYHISLFNYINYIKDCKNLKRYNSGIKTYKIFPFFSLCTSTYNMEKYIEISILSILNQSFQDFEIIIVNDLSTDNTINIIKRLQIEDNRIKLINHNKNLGTYHCRAEAVLNSRGKYILFFDPDDIYLNPNLFEILYYYNLILNLDIIEFTVYHSIERKKKYFFQKNIILIITIDLKKILYIIRN